MSQANVFSGDPLLGNHPKVATLPTGSSRLVPALALLVMAAALSGCLSSDGSEGLAADLEGYEEARDAPGLVLDPVQGASDVEVKLLAPASEEVGEPGTQPVVLLAHDPARGEPVTDADVTLEARMPAMGHGTGPEKDPTHAGGGIYAGETTWSMAGTWVLHLEVRLAEGDVLAYEPEISVGEHEGDPDAGPVEPFGSFGEVMAAPGTVYEGELLAPPRQSANVSAELTGADHQREEALALDRGELDNVRVTAQLDAQTPIDMLNVTLVDPDGNPAAVLQLDAQNAQAEASVAEATAGDWRLEITGEGIDASYEVHVEAVYHAHHVDLKLLDPADPSQGIGGDRGLLFAVFDAIAPAPVTDAEVNLTARPPDGTDPFEAAPDHIRHGQHRTATGLDAEGTWQVTVGLELPTGEAHRYAFELQVASTG